VASRRCWVKVVGSNPAGPTTALFFNSEKVVYDFIHGIFFVKEAA